MFCVTRLTSFVFQHFKPSLFDLPDDFQSPAPTCCIPEGLICVCCTVPINRPCNAFSIPTGFVPIWMNPTSHILIRVHANEKRRIPCNRDTTVGARWLFTPPVSNSSASGNLAGAMLFLWLDATDDGKYRDRKKAAQLLNMLHVLDIGSFLVLQSAIADVARCYKKMQHLYCK